MLTDRKFRLPRKWSNQELRRLAPQFTGDVVNVSAWRDSDKEGGYYRDYFENARSYTITNHPGHMGDGGGIELDLTKPLPDDLRQKFDVVFNFGVLEHVFEMMQAFANLAAMTKDVLIVGVPFLQLHHGFVDEQQFGDYWRFSPHAVERLYRLHGIEPLYMNANQGRNQSLYILCVGARNPAKWEHVRYSGIKGRLGSETIRNSLIFRALAAVKFVSGHSRGADH